MPIKIPNNLPAREILERERVGVISETDAIRQDIRPMRIALLNLMPNKIRTEAQIARLAGSTPLQVEMTLLHMASHESKNTHKQHLIDFYKTWDQVSDQKFDGLIITGAPIETLPFEDVTYWNELTQIFDWAQEHVFRTFNICWGAQAALHHFHGVPKHQLDEKMFGVFRHQVVRADTHLLHGFNDEFSIPVSRHTETRSDDIPDDSGLKILVESSDSGLCMIEEPARGAVYMFNHLEYDANTLKDEYDRDVAAGERIQLPRNYFPDDDPAKTPINQWRSYSHLLFWNWINEMYQHTPFDIAKIGRKTAEVEEVE